MNTRSIGFRLIFWYAGLLTGVFLLIALAMHAGVKNFLDFSMSEVATRRAYSIGESLLARIQTTGEAYVIEQIQLGFAPESNDRFIRIIRPDGSILYASGEAKDKSFDPGGLPIPRGKFNKPFSRTEQMRRGGGMLIAAVPFKDYLIEAGTPREPAEKILSPFVFSLALGFPLIIVVAVGGGYILVHRALTPVNQISKSAEQISLHNLSERVPVADTGDALEQLSLALNRMIDRIDKAVEQNRRFLADASHELRTPLSVLHGELETLRDRLEPTDETVDRLGSAIEEVERLSKIVEGLLAISRLEAGETQGEWSRVDLSQLISTTAEQMCLLAQDKNISVLSNIDEGILVRGDGPRLKQVIVNLLDNAIKYTPTGGSIRLRARARQDEAIFEVEDTGIGIPAKQLPHVFERFFRVDPARTREMGGTGLGLSIVRSICLAHGGRVDVHSQEGRGSQFTVRLPLIQAGKDQAAPLTVGA